MKQIYARLVVATAGRCGRCGRILAVGDLAGFNAYVGDETTIIDRAGHATRTCPCV